MPRPRDIHKIHDALRPGPRPMSHPPGTILGMSRHPLAALTTRLRTWTLLHLQRVVVWTPRPPTSTARSAS